MSLYLYPFIFIRILWLEKYSLYSFTFIVLSSLPCVLSSSTPSILSCCPSCLTFDLTSSSFFHFLPFLRLFLLTFLSYVLHFSILPSSSTAFSHFLESFLHFAFPFFLFSFHLPFHSSVRLPFIRRSPASYFINFVHFSLVLSFYSPFFYVLASFPLACSLSFLPYSHFFISSACFSHISFSFLSSFMLFFTSLCPVANLYRPFNSFQVFFFPSVLLSFAGSIYACFSIKKTKHIFRNVS